MAPHPDSAAAAAETLRAELEMVVGALESIDRKAAVLPAVLGAIAGIFIAPDQTFTKQQPLTLAIALGSGVASVAVGSTVRIAAPPLASTRAPYPYRPQP